jgi:predicted transcriptional regulator
MNVKLRKIEVEEATATALEARAAELGLSVSELLAEMVGASAKLSDAELAALDRQWTAIKNGEPTVAHDEVVRWLDTWGTSAFRPWKDR